ncbi:MAG: ABC transporter ATP-binding protein [Ignavibacteria bacterium]|nr:ABC transporter ATP-binding protein [Ignavibacteria bacterium]
MTKIGIEVNNLKKVFGRRLIFKNIDFTLCETQSLIITGKNGSGKSTLVKILAGVLSFSSGSIKININGQEFDKEKYYEKIGLVSPYLVLYDEFSAYENLEMFSRIRGIKVEKEKIESILEEIGLIDRRKDLYRTFSSGMKQRMKYASAILHEPSILLVDEPTSNLDMPGKEFVQNLIERYRRDRVVIVATNENEDFRFADNVINLDSHK